MEFKRVNGHDMGRHLRLLACLLVGVAGMCGVARPADPPSAESAFARLKALSGTWRLVAPATARASAFRISYRAISRGTALVETFGDPAGDVTETIYHLDGSRLMLTHYCAQGNQPRLALAPDSETTALHFTFLDATNLAQQDDSHLVDLRFGFQADGNLRREEIYREKGKDETSVLVLEPVRMP